MSHPLSSKFGDSLRAHPLGAAGAVLLLCFAIAALFAPILAPHQPNQLHLETRLATPSLQYLFGTDELGRDTLSRTLYGARVSLTVAIAVVSISLAVGILLGGLAGFYRGFADTVINQYLVNIFLAMPGILLAIAMAAFLGPGLGNLIFALALSGWVGYARLVRAQVIAIQQKEFVEAARALGASDLRIFFHHILPNSLPPLVVQAAVGMASAVLAEATLSFLGLGLPAPTPSWGSMLNEARSHLFDAPHLVVFPALAVMLSVLSFNLIGDSLRDHLDPRIRAQVAN